MKLIPDWIYWVALVGLLSLAATLQLKVVNGKERMAEVLQLHAETLTNIANLAERSAEAARIAQTAWTDAVAHIDNVRTQGKEDALLQNENLRAAVAAGTHRLRIAGTCTPARSRDVPQDGATSSMDPAPSLELPAAAGSTVFSIRAGIIADQESLKALQEYASICAK